MTGDSPYRAAAIAGRWRGILSVALTAFGRTTTGLYGNTTAGTIPLALGDARRAGRLKKGDLVLLASVGAGFTVGAVLLRWSL